MGLITTRMCGRRPVWGRRQSSGPGRAAAVIAAASLLFAAAAPAPAAPKAGAALATYQGGVVTAAEFEASQTMKLGPEGYAQLRADRTALRNAVLREALLNVVAALATAGGLRESAAFKDRLRANEDKAYAALWREKVGREAVVTDAELDEMLPPLDDEVRVQWASFGTGEEAARYAAALRAGAGVEDAARAAGTEPLLGESILSAGAQTHFSDASKRAILALKVGEIAGPLEEPVGWYVLRATERTSAETRRARKREQLRPDVAAAKRTQALADAAAALRAKARITVDEQALADPGAVGSGRAVAEVNGEAVVFSPEPSHGFPQHEMSKVLRKQLDRQIDEMLAAQEGRRLGLERSDPRWKPALDAYAVDVLAGLYREQVFAMYKVDEDEVRDYYTRHPEQFKTPVTLRVRQIVLPGLFLAQRYRDDLLAGRAVFEELAKRESLDRESAVIGGDQGWMPENAVREEVRQYVEAMKVGEISVPIPVGGNFYLIKLEARTEAQLLPYEQVREQARPRALLAKRTTSWQEFLDRKQKEAQVTLDDAAIDKLVLPAK